MFHSPFELSSTRYTPDRARFISRIVPSLASEGPIDREKAKKHGNPAANHTFP
jgi:hypothetical protein